MPWDIAVELEDRPGALAELGRAAGDAGVNIAGVCGSAFENDGVIHVLVDDPDQAASAFEGAGLRVQGRREVLVVDVEDEPGVLGETARRFAEAGINIELVYLATDTRLVFGVNDLESARSLV